MEDKLVEGGVGELAEVVLEIGPCRLRPGSNGVREVLIVVATGTGFEEMRTILVNAGNEQANTIGSFGGVLGLDLGLCMWVGLLSAILKMSLLSGWLDPYVSL